jgi:hypothetical protein
MLASWAVPVVRLRVVAPMAAAVQALCSGSLPKAPLSPCEWHFACAHARPSRRVDFDTIE